MKYKLYEDSLEYAKKTFKKRHPHTIINSTKVIERATTSRNGIYEIDYRNDEDYWEIKREEAEELRIDNRMYEER
jgi:hypothetical protein